MIPKKNWLCFGTEARYLCFTNKPARRNQRTISRKNTRRWLFSPISTPSKRIAFRRKNIYPKREREIEKSPSPWWIDLFSKLRYPKSETTLWSMPGNRGWGLPRRHCRYALINLPLALERASLYASEEREREFILLKVPKDSPFLHVRSLPHRLWHEGWRGKAEDHTQRAADTLNFVEYELLVCVCLRLGVDWLSKEFFTRQVDLGSGEFLKGRT